MRNKEVIAQMLLYPPEAFVSTFTREGKTRDVKRVDLINGSVRLTADGDIDGIIPPPPDSRDGELYAARKHIWMQRAFAADSYASMFRTFEDINDDDEQRFWIFGNKWKIVFSGLKCSRMLTAAQWVSVWDNVAAKCREKAKKFKW